MNSETQTPNASTDAPSVSILGCRVHLVTLDETVDQMERWIRNRDGQCRRITVTGFHGLWEAYQDAGLRAVLNGADLWVPDGIAPVWAARLRRHRNVGRVPGMDIMREFFRRANVSGYSSYFYGDTEPTLFKLREQVSDSWPGHRIAGMLSPPFRAMTKEEDRETIERISSSGADVLWVGLGAPKQERWIHERMHRLKVPVAIGVGAAFRFIAGTVQRCPDWLGRIGFEWAYRFAREPGKLWRRDLVDGPRFLYHVGLELAGLRKNH